MKRILFAAYLLLLSPLFLQAEEFDISQLDERVVDLLDSAHRNATKYQISDTWKLIFNTIMDVVKDDPSLLASHKPLAEYALRYAEIIDLQLPMDSHAVWPPSDLSDLYLSYLWLGMPYFKHVYGTPPWYSDYLAAPDKKDYMRNMDWVSVWREYAAKNDPIAIYYLGITHDARGEYALAYRSIRKAADMGVLRAQALLYKWYGTELTDSYGDPVAIESISNTHDWRLREWQHYAGRVSADSDESHYWLFRMLSQVPTNDLLRGMYATFSLKVYRAEIRLQIQERAASRQTTAHPRAVVHYDEYLIMMHYILASYYYSTADNDDVAVSRRFDMARCKRMLMTENLEEAIILARSFVPKLEISPYEPLANGIINYVVRDDERLWRKRMNDRVQHLVVEFNNPVDPAHTRERSGAPSPLPASSRSDDLQTQMLLEQRRANLARESREERRDTREALQMLLNEIHRHRSASPQRSQSYEIRSRYPSFNSDPTAPGSPFNPYIVEPR